MGKAVTTGKEDNDEDDDDDEDDAADDRLDELCWCGEEEETGGQGGEDNEWEGFLLDRHSRSSLGVSGKVESDDGEDYENVNDDNVIYHDNGDDDD